MVLIGSLLKPFARLRGVLGHDVALTVANPIQMVLGIIISSLGRFQKSHGGCLVVPLDFAVAIGVYVADVVHRRFASLLRRQLVPLESGQTVP